MSDPFKIDIITIFPEMFAGPFGFSIVRRALEKKCVEINIINLRDYATDRHRSVDDYPYGGGAGMVFKPEPLFRCLDSYVGRGISNRKIYLTSPRGVKCEQKHFDNIARDSGIIIICGHYEGVDQRVIDYYDITEISIGDYVLSGGEIPAMAIVDGIVRLLPGVLGNIESIKDESFRSGVLEYPQYTRPSVFGNLSVPEILLSGDHKKIEEWRRKQAIEYTKKMRPDLLD